MGENAADLLLKRIEKPNRKFETISAAAGIAHPAVGLRNGGSLLHQRFQRFIVRCSSNSTFSDDAADITIWRHVECGVFHRSVVGRYVHSAYVSHFRGGALFDGDHVAGVERRGRAWRSERLRRTERCFLSQAPAPIVPILFATSPFAAMRSAAHNDTPDPPRLEEVPCHVVRDQRRVDVVLLQVPTRSVAILA